MERNKVLSLPEKLQENLKNVNNEIIDHYKELQTTSRQAKAELRRLNNSLAENQIKLSKSNLDATHQQVLQENADNLRKQIDEARKQSADIDAEYQKIAEFLNTNNSKGYKAAYDLVKEDPSFLQESPYLGKWLQEVSPIISKDFALKSKQIAVGAGLTGIAAGIYAWLHQNPPSLFAKEIGEAQAQLSKVDDMDVSNTKQALSNLSDYTTITDEDLKDPEKIQGFINTLAQTKQTIDSSLAQLDGNPKAQKELNDVSKIIGSRLNSLGKIVGVDANEQETGAANSTPSYYKQSGSNLKQIQQYLSKIDPRVVPSGKMDRQTENAIRTIETDIQHRTGKDVIGLINKNGKLMDYKDFVSLMEKIY